MLAHQRTGIVGAGFQCRPHNVAVVGTQRIAKGNDGYPPYNIERLRPNGETGAPERLRIRMWCFPYLTYVAIAGMLGIVIAMAFIPDQRQPLMLGVVSLIVLMIAFGVRYTYGRPPTLAPTSSQT